MTNDEIEKRAGVVVDEYLSADFLANRGELSAFLAQAIREAVSQAYEECAKVADFWDSGNNGDHCDNVAIEIRALNDSLNATPEGTIK